MRGAHADLSPNLGDPARPVPWHTWQVWSYTALPSALPLALAVCVAPDGGALGTFDAFATFVGAGAAAAGVAAAAVAGGAADAGAGAADAVCVGVGSFQVAPAWSAM